MNVEKCNERAPKILYRANTVSRMPQRTLKRPHSALTLPELQRLLTELEGTARTIVVLAASLGLRIGEILALRWNRIDFDRGILRVAETNYKGAFWHSQV